MRKGNGKKEGLEKPKKDLNKRGKEEENEGAVIYL